MKIKFIGVGSAFTTNEYYQSNMLITAPTGKKMLLDCGSDARFSLADAVAGGVDPLSELDAIYVSHLHADHIGGLEWVAFSTFFNPDLHTLKLFVEESLIEPLWHHSLKGGLACVEGRLLTLQDYFACTPLRSGVPFDWEGVRLTPVRMPHMSCEEADLFSYGLILEQLSNGASAFVTTDTKYCPEILEAILPGVDMVFHDCETSSQPSGVHAHYNELCCLDRKARAKLWLYHYLPSPDQNPESDGFLGFVKKGQEFSLGE
ncbi:MAG: MBL fold hydrolase [Proteobacteria bacterium]|nr:MAG: MBL fold hydrolase [Pseudomonadota bacterium]